MKLVLGITLIVFATITTLWACYSDKRPAPLANHCGADCQDCCTYTLYTPPKEECYSTYPNYTGYICSVGPEKLQFVVDHYKLGDCNNGECDQGQFDWGTTVTNMIPKLTACGG